MRISAHFKHFAVPSRNKNVIEKNGTQPNSRRAKIIKNIMPNTFSNKDETMR
ncbi:MAG: hypothetical protein ACI96W_003902 [Paraglaciecola sp.]